MARLRGLSFLHRGRLQREKDQVPCMDKRSRFIAELLREAKARGLELREEAWRGKGGHAMIWVGDKVTTLPSREVDPKTAKKILKALGLDDP